MTQLGPFDILADLTKGTLWKTNKSENQLSSNSRLDGRKTAALVEEISEETIQLCRV